LKQPREPRARILRRRIDGVLLLDKPVGMSSNAALQAARRAFRAEKAGHTGTLDPLASGLLPLCFGEATKFAGELLDADKQYFATVQLGVTTDTADAEGVILQTRPVVTSRPEIEAVLSGFLGDIDQVPPMYSALKRDGKPLYEYARAGIEIDRAARRVRIHELGLDSCTLDEGANRISFSVRCSKGTYVRTLAADIGERLGCGAHLAALRRTAIGALDVASAVSLATLESTSASARDELLYPPDFLLGTVDAVRLDTDYAARLRHGQPVKHPGTPGQRWRAYDETGVFIGLCLQTEGLIKPLRLIATGADPTSPDEDRMQET